MLGVLLIYLHSCALAIPVKPLAAMLQPINITSYIIFVQWMLSAMEIYDLLVAVIIEKEELRFITIQRGVQFVMIAGIPWMLELCADS